VKLRMAIRRGMLILAAVVTLTAVPVGIASASHTSSHNPTDATPFYLTSKCTVKSHPLVPSTSCKTGTIPHSANRDIHYSMCAAPHHYADWQIKDAANGHIVAQGRVNDGVCTNDVVKGLFGNYWGWVFNTRDGASASIANF
jgi:hypothetical protein